MFPREKIQHAAYFVSQSCSLYVGLLATTAVLHNAETIEKIKTQYNNDTVHVHDVSDVVGDVWPGNVDTPVTER